MQIRDSVVVVTGAGSGIGAALARRFAEEGAAVVVVSDRDATAAAAVAAEIDAVADATDVTSEQAVAALVARTEERFGRIDPVLLERRHRYRRRHRRLRRGVAAGVRRA